MRIPGLLSLLLAWAPAVGAEVGTRPPPLSEGVVLTRVFGTLVPGTGDSGWSFRLRDAFEGEADRELELLPAAALEDMVRRFESMTPGGEARFELSGSVTLYRGGNAVLPWMAVPVNEFGPRAARVPLRPPGAVVAAPVQPADTDVAVTWPSGADASAAPFGIRWVPLLPQARQQAAERPLGRDGDVQGDEIERQLMARVGEAARSMDTPKETAPAADVAPGGVDPLRGRPWLDSDRTVQDRLGVVTRDPVTGGWRFVFESSRGELGEREATLLPGQVLERLERVARSQPGPISVVLSGTVTRFQGRVYLLPSGFGAPVAGKALGR